MRFGSEERLMGRLTARARDANDILLDTFREAVPGIGDRRFDRRRRVFFLGQILWARAGKLSSKLQNPFEGILF